MTAKLNYPCLASVLLILAAGTMLLPGQVTITSLGTGTASLLGGDLTDPEDDGDDRRDPLVPGDDLADRGWNFVSAVANEKSSFADHEAAFNVFDNKLGPGQDKWCCNARNIVVEFETPVALTHFTLSSANDVPNRDWREWSVSGSNDGITFETIYSDDGAVNHWPQRLEVVLFELDAPSAQYTHFKFEATSNRGDGLWQVGEIELFGQLDNTDTDGDMLPDWWEIANLPAGAELDDGTTNPDFGKDGDPDNDMSTNLDEFNRGTLPNDDDTDDDGLKDGVEDKGGTFVSASMTGTDPKKPDSDEDGLLDGVETNTGIFVSASDTGTDPNNPDTDGDITKDGEEVLLPGRNPNIADRPPTDFSTDLIAYWPQDGDHNNAYTILNDDYHGTVDGPPIPFDTGLFGEAAHLDGSHSIIIGGDPADLTLAGESITVSAWFTADVIDTNWQCLVAKGEGNSWRMHRRGGDNPPQMAWTGGNGDTPAHANPITVGGNPETWHHVAGVTDSETQIEILYFDGVEVARRTGAVLTANSPNPVRIGENPDALNRRWKGKIDDVAIWNRALEAEEIATLHGEGLAGTSLNDLLFGAGLNPLGLAVRNVGGQLEFSWNSTPGNLYDLVSNLDLESEIESWAAFGANTAIPATPDRNTLTIPYPADAERFFAIKQYPVPPIKAFSDDFESGAGSWVTADSGVPFPPNGNPSSPTATKWELGTPDAGVAGGPPAAHSGANCFGTALAAAYVEDTGISLTSPAIDLTNFVGGTLVYWRYHDIEGSFDWGRVRLLDAADDSEIAVLEDTIDGTITDWEEVRIDLPAEAAGKTVKIEFSFACDNFNTNPQAGFYIDDVCVEAVPE